jgi:hypothetical protein
MDAAGFTCLSVLDFASIGAVSAMERYLAPDWKLSSGLYVLSCLLVLWVVQLVLLALRQDGGKENPVANGAHTFWVVICLVDFGIGLVLQLGSWGWGWQPSWWQFDTTDAAVVPGIMAYCKWGIFVWLLILVALHAVCRSWDFEELKRRLGQNKRYDGNEPPREDRQPFIVLRQPAMQPAPQPQMQFMAGQPSYQAASQFAMQTVVPQPMLLQQPTMQPAAVTLVQPQPPPQPRPFWMFG